MRNYDLFKFQRVLHWVLLSAMLEDALGFLEKEISQNVIRVTHCEGLSNHESAGCT